ncbi:phosphotransferase family protein [Fictibacillus sp. Mic-4]|uniref:phosphotransferase family protein n=1 Tax=Fictibacillus TaxID=1329200 RepID=UPI00047BFC82|nr:phosphotransferase family protein [Fictibacillus gelatini]
MKVNGLEYILGEDWEVVSAGGATGEAYLAQQGEQKLFLKRNSSPFLAVLSAEGIVPKLLWTKRLANGDVITAQVWLDGRELKASEMLKKPVAELLGKIHRSTELLGMLKRLGKTPLSPDLILKDIQARMSGIEKLPEDIHSAFDFLAREKDHIEYEHKVVCHCDINHNNWLISEQEELFLIDWDGAMIADPALDLGMLLYWYVPEVEWKAWLHNYGLELTENLQKRMFWYVIVQTIQSIFWHTEREKSAEKQYWMNFLRQLMSSKMMANHKS